MFALMKLQRLKGHTASSTVLFRERERGDKKKGRERIAIKVLFFSENVC